MQIKNVLLILAGVVLLVGAVRAEDKAEADKKALAPMRGYVGEWRGAGSPKDNPNPNASWGEDAEWSWDFKGGKSALVFTAPKARYYTAGRLEPGEKAGSFHFIGTTPAKTQEEFSGEVDKEGDLILDAKTPTEGHPSRVSVSLVAKGKRMVVQYQRESRGTMYAPIAEVGFTLKGSGFGQGGDMHECVVTGGTGKFTVSYKGQTYWVCCGGCRDQFNENPEKELAEFKKRKEEEKAR